MKKILPIFTIILPALLFGCAAKEPPFDPVAKFREAEEKMQRFKYEEARKAYQEIQEKAPDRSYDADIMLRIADTYYGEEKYSEAQVEYQAFINFHPVHRDASYAQYQIGLCSYNDLTTIDRDPDVARTALKEFQKLLEKYPGSPYEDHAKKYIVNCRNRLSEYELYVGKFYFRKGSYKAAIGRLEKLLNDYAGSTAEKDALYYTALSYRKMGENKIALRTFETLIAKYPNMKNRVSDLMLQLHPKP